MEKMKRFIFNRKGVSPVIATIIIVAVAIVMSIAVAYWVLGLGASLTRYEKVAFISAYATGDETTSFTINMQLKNTGSATATIDDSIVMLNGIPTSDVGGTVNITPLTLTSGEATTAATITGLTKANGFSSGMTVEILIQTTAGNQYPKVIVLP
jgi:flagellin-like protein